MSQGPLNEPPHRRVGVRAHGIRCRGILHGADEETLYLKGPTGYRAVPMNRISTARAKRAEAEARDRKENPVGLSADFYETPGT